MSQNEHASQSPLATCPEGPVNIICKAPGRYICFKDFLKHKNVDDIIHFLMVFVAVFLRLELAELARLIQNSSWIRFFSRVTALNDILTLISTLNCGAEKLICNELSPLVTFSTAYKCMTLTPLTPFTPLTPLTPIHKFLMLK